MSDTVLYPAPVQSGSESSLVEAGARRLAALAVGPQPVAPTPASPEAEGTTAPPAQSEAQPAPGSLEEVGTGEETGETPAQQEQAEDPDPVVFTHDDGTVVRKSEAPEHLMRWKDYSQKTELVAQARDALIQNFQTQAQTREMLAQRLEATLPQVDDGLRYSDPGAWAAQVMERNEHLRQIAQYRAEAQGDRERVTEYNAAEIEKTLYQVLPKWRDEEVAKAEQKLAREYVAAIGWPAASIELARRDPYVIAAVLEAAKHRAVVKGAAKGGAASAANRLQPSPSIAQAQVRPPPVGTAAQRQQQSMRSGEAVRTPTRPGGLRTRYDLGASRLRPLAR